MTTRVRLLPYGDQAVLAEADAGHVLALAAIAAAADGVLEVVPAARTLLIRYDPHRTGPDRLRDVLESTDPARSAAPTGPPVEIPVRYDGADLEQVARVLDVTPDEVVRLHTGPEYSVAFCGFSPGFGYLTGLDPKLQLPRLATPRTRVPAGAVGIAGEFTAVYPRSSPGGWLLLGTTAAAVWDPARAEPALLRPGVRVRFRAA